MGCRALEEMTEKKLRRPDELRFVTLVDQSLSSSPTVMSTASKAQVYAPPSQRRVAAASVVSTPDCHSGQQRQVPVAEPLRTTAAVRSITSARPRAGSRIPECYVAP